MNVWQMCSGTLSPAGHSQTRTTRCVIRIVYIRGPYRLASQPEGALSPKWAVADNQDNCAGLAPHLPQQNVRDSQQPCLEIRPMSSCRLSRQCGWKLRRFRALNTFKTAVRLMHLTTGQVARRRRKGLANQEVRRGIFRTYPRFNQIFAAQRRPARVRQLVIGQIRTSTRSNSTPPGTGTTPVPAV